MYNITFFKEIIMFHRFQVIPHSFSNPRDIVQDFFNRLPNSQLEAMHVDIVEKQDAFELKLNVPGFSKEDISIDLEDGVLKVTASKTQDNKEEAEKYLLRERSTQTLSRSFNLSDNVDVSGIKANQEHGVLTITVPKKAPQLPTSQKINID